MNKNNELLEKSYNKIIENFNHIMEKISSLGIKNENDFNLLREEDFSYFKQLILSLLIDFENTALSLSPPYLFSEQIDKKFINIKKDYRATLTHTKERNRFFENGTKKDYSYAKKLPPDKNNKKEVYNFFGIGKILKSKAINFDGARKIYTINRDFRCSPETLPDNLELDTFLELILTQLNHPKCKDIEIKFDISTDKTLQKFLDDSSKNENKIKIKILGFSTMAPTQSKMLEWMKNDCSEELINNMISNLKISEKIKILENKIIPSDSDLCDEASVMIQGDIINLIMENGNG